MKEKLIAEKLIAEMETAERKAFDSLSRYKFQMFGYWAAIWVHLNRISGLRRPSPFRALVNAAAVQNVGYLEHEPELEQVEL